MPHKYGVCYMCVDVPSLPPSLPQVDLNVLSPEEEQILQKTMHRLAEKVRGWNWDSQHYPPTYMHLLCLAEVACF